jgi:hypothetical protein
MATPTSQFAPTPFRNAVIAGAEHLAVATATVCAAVAEPHGNKPAAVMEYHKLLLMMMVIISPFGQLGLWEPSSGVRDVFTLIASTVRALRCVKLFS